MASQDEIISIVKDFLKSAPPGEFLEVVTDVRTLLKNDELLNSLAPEAFRTYNHEQMSVVQNGDKKVLLTSHGHLDGNSYLDPTNKQVFTYDHIKQQVTGSKAAGGGDMDADVEPYRKAFEDAALKYTEEHYPGSGTCAVYGMKEGGNHKIVVCISSALFNAKNYWGGRWRSTWVCTFKPGSGNCTMNGNFKIQVHYYEEGNVQLNTNTDKTKSIPVADAAALADKALKTISAVEGDFHTQLDKSYNTMGNTTFKALRRALPIIRKKIDWEKIMSYRLGGELSGGGTIGK